MHGPAPGSLALPGAYTVRLSMAGSDGWEHAQPFNLIKDPRIKMTKKQFAEQFKQMQALNAKTSEAKTTVNKIRSATGQIDGWLERMAEHDEIESLKEMGNSVKEQLTQIEDVLIQKHFKSFGDVLNHPYKLIERISTLPAVIGGSDNPPTEQSLEVMGELSAAIDEQIGNLEEVMDTGLAAFNNKLKELQTPAVYVG